jgi:Tfp pilus assembly protein PilF
MMWREGASLFMDIHKFKSILMILLLVLAILIVYGKVRSFDFIDFDDNTIYVKDNPYIQSGLSINNVLWAFSLDSSRNTRVYYHPLTWLSHMADIQFFHLNPGMHHLTNLFFHLVNTLILFFLLWKMTNAYWRSLLVASIFALHPLNVETVAWISERKNLLSSCFFLLTLYMYWFYTKKPNISRYMLILAVFACCLLSKPMLVTLPFVLLLLDYWPLNRFEVNSIGEGTDRPAIGVAEKKTVAYLILEKIPLFILASLSVCISLVSLQSCKEILIPEKRQMSLRIAHAIVSYIIYLRKMILPLNLAVFHPYPLFVPLWKIIVALMLIVGFTVLALIMRKKYPFIIVGWLWYLGTLVPVLGIIQAGLWPSYGERWAYIPLIGIFIIIAWGMPPILRKLRFSRAFIGVITLIMLIFWGCITWIQTGYWKDSQLLFSHAVDVTEDNFVMQNKLAIIYERLGLVDLALTHYKEALRIKPDNAGTHTNLGNLYVDLGNYKEAMKHLVLAQQLQPYDAFTSLNIGYTIAHFGEPEKAIEYYKHALVLNPHFATAYFNLGIVYMQLNKMDKAILSFQKAIQIQPDFGEAHFNLGNAFASLGSYDEALQQYNLALIINPKMLSAKANKEILLEVIEKNKHKGAK